MWIYLEEGGYLNSLFADWYTTTLWWLFFGVLVVSSSVAFLPFILHFFWKRSAPTIPTHSRLPDFVLIRWHAVKQLFRSKKLKKRRLGLAGFVLLASAIYAFLHWLIIVHPDVLTAGGVQSLAAKDVRYLVDFLYRFAFLGGFLLIVTPASSLGLFTGVLYTEE